MTPAAPSQPTSWRRSHLRSCRMVCLPCVVMALRADVAGRTIHRAHVLRSPLRIAVAAAARRADDQRIVRVEMVRAFAGEDAAAAQAKLARRAGPAAGASARRMIDAIERGEQRERSAVERADLHLLAEAAARGAIAAGAGAQFAFP